MDAAQQESGRAKFEKASKRACSKEITALQEKEKGVVALLKINKLIVDNNLPFMT